MAKVLQIRNMPDAIHAELKRRGALAGMTLNSYLLKMIEADISVPTPAEMWARLKSREPVILDRSVAEILRDRSGDGDS